MSSESWSGKSSCWMAQGGGFDGSAAGRAADAEIDAAGIERVQGAEGFGHLERRVVRQHDAARAEPDAGGFGADAGQHDLRRGAGEQLHGMVLGHPETGVAEGFDVLGERDGVAQGVGRRRAGGDGGLIEDGEAEGGHMDWMKGGLRRARRGYWACAKYAIESYNLHVWIERQIEGRLRRSAMTGPWWSLPGRARPERPLHFFGCSRHIPSYRLICRAKRSRQKKILAAFWSDIQRP